MTTKDVSLIEESQSRYLTYALSVVSSRALPDVRDGLKPVQRRILYAMSNNLNLGPDHHHRKSAAVVGEVLARYHPHGDSACYEAMVRMAQDFSLRYPLVDGQGNFGSLDGDGAAAYRYTEARLTPIALEVIGDIGQETVAERPNFDQTVSEPIVLPSRVPNLLMNGASGIAVGMATAIPPHNLRELVKALTLLIEDPELPDAKLFTAVKAPDFPTGCLIVNSAAELREIYRTGRGAIRMRGAHTTERGLRGKEFIVITSVPFGVDKSTIVEKIADLILQKKVPQLVDIRDESTDIVRVVLELNSGPGELDARAEKVMAYLCKHTPLQTNFNVNLTALTPTNNPLSGKPELLSLRQMLQHFVDFRLEVTRCKLEFEKRRLEERIHLLEGLMAILKKLDEVIDIVRKSDGRADAAKKLQQRFKLTEVQSLFIVDLRIYQLSRTNVDEVKSELEEKQARVAAIVKILSNKKALRAEVSKDLTRISEEYGDERRSKIVAEVEEQVINEDEFIQHEEVFVIVTSDGWVKRIRSSNDPLNTRLREGDTVAFVGKADTRDTVGFFTSQGNLFVSKVYDLSTSTGFGESIQKMFRFQDGETIVRTVVSKADPELKSEYVFFTEHGVGFRLEVNLGVETKKIGRKLVKLRSDDRVVGVEPVSNKHCLALISAQGYVLLLMIKELPLLSGAGKGVQLIRLPKEDRLAAGKVVDKNEKLKIQMSKGGDKELELKPVTIGERARRGERLINRNTPVIKVIEDSTKVGE